MKPKSPRRLLLATLGCLAVQALPLSAETTQETPVTRDNNKPVGTVSPPAPIVNATETTTTRAHPEMMRSDQRLIKKTAACNDYESAISRQATRQASNPQVRSYAEMIVSDHERMNREITTLSARRGMIFHSDQRYQNDVTDLSRKTGRNYDKAYLDEMIDSHEDAIDFLERASKSTDTDVAAFAVQYLPTLRDHLARVRQLEKLIE